MFDYLIVGADFAGSVCAERLATSGNKIVICEQRPHIAHASVPPSKRAA